MPKETLKVCFVSHSSPKTGAGGALLELIDTLKKRNVKCYAIVPGYGPLTTDLESREIVYSVFPYHWWMSHSSPIWNRMKRSAWNLGMAILVARRIKQWKCDIVFTNTVTICVGALAAKFLCLPHIWYIHEFGYEDHGLIFDLGGRFSLWLVDRLSSVCIVNSYAVAQKYQRYITSSKLKVVYYSMNLAQRLSAREVAPAAQYGNGIRCIIVGALRKGKKQEDAIQAIGKLVRGGIKASLLIVGPADPRYATHLYDLVTKNKLDEYVKFVSCVENPFPLMQSADVVLMCSRREAFGRVTVEAMLAGKPVIGARSGGTIELIRDGFNGLLYTPGDYEELAEKIKYLYEHLDEARQMGENGLRWAEKRFTEERYGEEMLSVLKQLLVDRRDMKINSEIL